MKGEMKEITEAIRNLSVELSAGQTWYSMHAKTIDLIRLLAANVEALEKRDVLRIPQPHPNRDVDREIVEQILSGIPSRPAPPHKPKPSQQTLVDCAAHARELSIAIEDLPASGQQTVCSIQAASLSQKLHALLRQAPALPEAQQKQGHVSQAAFFTKELQDIEAKEQQESYDPDEAKENSIVIAELSRLRDLVRTLESESVCRIKHLNRLATWAQQDPTGPLPEWMGSKVQSWVLNEIRCALGGQAEPQQWSPQYPNDKTEELARLRDLVRWRDAEKEKPDLPGDYPTLHDWNRNGFTLSCTRYDGRWFGQGVSHWLALPPLPKETK